MFFDIEAMQPHEQHIANLIVAETEDDDQPIRFPGEYCTRDFLEWLDTLTMSGLMAQEKEHTSSVNGGGGVN